MVKPNVLILTGYGINCDEETAYAFERAGARAELVHVNDVISKQRKLSDYQIMVFPGGFSYGDDTGAGNGLANRIRNHLGDEIKEFVEKDHLVIGICNGFQVLTNLGVVPALNRYQDPQVALVNNDFPRYKCRWVDLHFVGQGPWVQGLGRISMPIAHGEGKFYAAPATLQRIKEKGLIAAKYVPGSMSESQGLDYNPNGSLEDIAGITDETGRILGMMPHPERAIDFTQVDGWTLIREQCKRAKLDVPEEADGIKIFRNGVNYFR